MKNINILRISNIIAGIGCLLLGLVSVFATVYYPRQEKPNNLEIAIAETHGFNMAMDTIISIMRLQNGNDTTVSHVVLCKKDTVSYYISYPSCKKH